MRLWEIFEYTIFVALLFALRQFYLDGFYVAVLLLFLGAVTIPFILLPVAIWTGSELNKRIVVPTNKIYAFSKSVWIYCVVTVVLLGIMEFANSIAFWQQDHRRYNGSDY